MGFKLGKNGLLKRTAKPQLTRKQNKLLKLQKRLDKAAIIASQSKTIITRRAGEVVQKTTIKVDSVMPADDPICPLCKSKMELKHPKAGQDWKAFWGCLNFKKTGCKGSRKQK